LGRNGFHVAYRVGKRFTTKLSIRGGWVVTNPGKSHAWPCNADVMPTYMWKTLLTSHVYVDLYFSPSLLAQSAS
jgi:hypothetical protein